MRSDAFFCSTRHSWRESLGAVRAAPGLLVMVVLALAPSSLLGQDFSEVEAAQDAKNYARVASLLEQMSAGNENNVAWLWRMARSEFDRAYQLEEKDPRRHAHLSRGRVHAKEALELDDASSKAHLWYAIIVGQIAFYEGNEAKIQISREIKEHALRTIALDPKCVQAYHMMGRWHYELADLSWFERTLAEALYGKLPEASYDESIQFFKSAIALEADNISHWLWMARAQIESDKRADALETLRAAVKRSPRDEAESRELDEAKKLLSKLS